MNSRERDGEHFRQQEQPVERCRGKNKSGPSNCRGEEGCGRRGPRGRARQDWMNQSPWTMGDSIPWAKSGLEHLILHPSPPAAISYVIRVTITVPGSVLEEREGHWAFPTQPALGKGRCAESHCLPGARQRAVGQSSVLVTVG